jgi:hypothetical protein
VTLAEFIKSLNVRAPALIIVAGKVVPAEFAPDVVLGGAASKRMDQCEDAVALARSENRVVVAFYRGDFFKASQIDYSTLGIQVIVAGAEVVHSKLTSVGRTATLG